ncbi:MAG: PfkB family carbohydrate kinase, partial [Actinomycetota bacterium]|nr:PfkB family carbohydrate kinase [Actinomycetota bacterium]
MILTVTLNAALDVTYEVASLTPHRTHRVQAVHHRAGGKGVNAAGVLTTLGVPATATGLLGGRAGEDIVADLDRRGIAHAFFRCAEESRRTVNVVSVDDGDATIFNEPGPVVSPSEWDDLLAGLPPLIESTGCTAVVLAGSLPRGVPADAYGQLVAAVRGRGARVVLDADGAALR